MKTKIERIKELEKELKQLKNKVDFTIGRGYIYADGEIVADFDLDAPININKSITEDGKCLIAVLYDDDLPHGYVFDIQNSKSMSKKERLIRIIKEE